MTNIRTHISAAVIAIAALLLAIAGATAIAQAKPGKDPHDRVTICHIDADTGEAKTKALPAPAIDAHLGHGDTLGECPAPPPVEEPPVEEPPVEEPPVEEPPVEEPPVEEPPVEERPVEEPPVEEPPVEEPPVEEPATLS